MTLDVIFLCVGVVIGVIAAFPVAFATRRTYAQLDAWERERFDRQYRALYGEDPVIAEEPKPEPEPVAEEPAKTRWELLELYPRGRAMPALPSLRRRWAWKWGAK